MYKLFSSVFSIVFIYLVFVRLSQVRFTCVRAAVAERGHGVCVCVSSHCVSFLHLLVIFLFHYANDGRHSKRVMSSKNKLINKRKLHLNGKRKNVKLYIKFNEINNLYIYI